MACKNAVFDWSTLDRENLSEFLWLISEKIINQPLDVHKFHAIIAAHIRRYLPVRVSKLFNKKVFDNHVFIGGTYYHDYDEEQKKCIEVVFVYQSRDSKLCLSSKKFKNMCYSYADTLLHEIIHMRQYRRRKFKILPDYPSTIPHPSKRQQQSYLGASDEIDAYGFNIACELFFKYKDNPTDIINHLNQSHPTSKVRVDSWKMYLKAFNHDHEHEIIKRLKKRVIKYLPHAQAGKPYRNRDWINW